MKIDQKARAPRRAAPSTFTSLVGVWLGESCEAVSESERLSALRVAQVRDARRVYFYSQLALCAVAAAPWENFLFAYCFLQPQPTT